MKRHVCGMCGSEYKPEERSPVFGVKPGTPFKDLPNDWLCPVCSVGQDKFSSQ